MLIVLVDLVPVLERRISDLKSKKGFAGEIPDAIYVLHGGEISVSVLAPVYERVKGIISFMTHS